MRHFLTFVLCVATFAMVSSQEMGHSKHGTAFDSGMRSRPWKMPGIGSAPFPVTSKNREVQTWFNQGNALLHSFWFEEAERSFRWCLKLDPDCAMAYWGLTQVGINWFSLSAYGSGPQEGNRYVAFLKEAVARKDKASDRERMYIETWEKAVLTKNPRPVQTVITGLKAIVAKYPNDVEAKALLGLYSIGETAPAKNGDLITEVLAASPKHPGAHHANIHNWDGINSEKAIASSALYGKVAPRIGHALHMPGHIYSKVGMWHEAAIAMDSATRIELGYMNDRMALPFETWNYPHNRNYLCYIQEQLGMASASMQGARDLLAAPHDPEYNPAEFGIGMQGQQALIRALVKFERWEELLTPGTVVWGTDDFSSVAKLYAQTLALSGLGRNSEAEDSLTELKAHIKKIGSPEGVPAAFFDEMFALYLSTLEGQVALAAGRTEEGLKALEKAAEAEAKQRKTGMYANDPPDQPWPVLRILGDAQRKHGQIEKAIKSYEAALVQEPNDGFTLAGLALAYHAAGNREKATEYAGRLEYVWSKADPGLRWLTEVRNLGLSAKPLATTPEPERVYEPQKLDRIGPMNWQPFAAPSLEVRDAAGKRVRLSDYKGKNVVLVFFLGATCAHCIQQLVEIQKQSPAFAAENTEILAVSSMSGQELKDAPTLKGLTMRFLSDNRHTNARRFASYDDFEEMELHSTIVIDKAGRVRWKRTGGDPFMNIKFLLDQLKRINQEK